MPRLDNRERFRKTVLEQKARMEQTLIPSGHQFINTRLRSAFNRAGFVSECLSGLNQVLFLRDLAGRWMRTGRPFWDPCGGSWVFW